MNYKIKAFTLIELIVVVALIGIIAAIGIKGYQGYIESAQKKVVKQNFINTVKYMKAEIAKCKLDRNAKAFGLPCPVQNNTRFQECAAVYLSWRYHIKNPLIHNAPSGWTASKVCPTVTTGSMRGGVRSGDGQKLGDVNIVICPRSPYCGRNSSTDGHFKVMWWWDTTSRYEDSRIVNIY